VKDVPDSGSTGDPRTCGETADHFVFVEGKAVFLCDWCIEMSPDYGVLEQHDLEADAWASCENKVED